MEWYWWVYGVLALGWLYQINKKLPIWVTAAWAATFFVGPWKFIQPDAVSISWWIIIGFPFAVSAVYGGIVGRIMAAKDKQSD